MKVAHGILGPGSLGKDLIARENSEGSTVMPSAIRKSRQQRTYWLWGLLIVACGVWTRTTGADLWYGVESLRNGELVVRRSFGSGGGSGGSGGGSWSGMVLASETPYRAWVFDPNTGLVGFSDFRTSPAGGTSGFPSVRLGLAYSMDSDGDGLSDDGEFVVGTDPTRADTDGDGIGDREAVLRGIDALAQLRTGVVGVVDTAGSARDVCAFDDVVAVADGARGVAVFNVLNRMPPIRIAQIPTLGEAVAVAGAGEWLAVADGTEGVAIVDLSDPPGARALQNRVGGFVQAVAVQGDIAYVGTREGYVIQLDMASGVRMGEVILGAAVDDLGLESGYLFAYAGGRLKVMSLFPNFTMVADRAALPNQGYSAETGRGRLFVGGGQVFLTHLGGYYEFGVSNPRSPSLVRNFRVNTLQLHLKQLALPSPGTLLAAMRSTGTGGGGTGLRRYSVAEPGGAPVVETDLLTPGDCLGFVVYNGFAYIADGNAGLSVLNFRSIDTKGIAPTGILVTTSADGTVVAGQRLFIQGRAVDDVQVRNVEFFADGTRIAVDGNLPFEMGWRVPVASAGRRVRLTAVASDTGGNRAELGAGVDLVVLPDTVPPTLTLMGPTPNSVLFDGDTIWVTPESADDVGVGGYEFAVDGVVQTGRRRNLKDWAIDGRWGLGRHELSVVAVDHSGNRSVVRKVTFRIVGQAISREVALFNFGPEEEAQGISKEVSVYAGALDPAPHAISREVSVNVP